MSEMPRGRVLVQHGTKLVTAVHDSFGVTLRGLHHRHEPGEIYSKRIDVHGDWIVATQENGESKSNFKILRSVHINTVKALQRKIGNSKQLYPRLHWYEVHGD